MTKRYFWRRSFAYVLDILICGLMATIISITLNNVFSTRVLAPSQIKSGECEIRDDLFSADRMNELLPLEDGQMHQQILCKQTNMLFTSFYITTLNKSWKGGNKNYNVHISYHSDENGKQLTYISSEPFLYLLAPFLFALFLTKYGQTPGKRLLGLIVYNDALEKPDIKSALKREYFKAVVFVIGALASFYTMYKAINFNIDEAATTVQSLAAALEQSNRFIPTITGFATAALVFWFHFGSFIRWRGTTYWDKFSSLTTHHVNEFHTSRSSKEW